MKTLEELMAARGCNARLCAAAPGLYAACLKALDRLGGCPWPKTRSLVAELRMALEAAGGAE